MNVISLRKTITDVREAVETAMGPIVNEKNELSSLPYQTFLLTLRSVLDSAPKEFKMNIDEKDKF